jgi:hypothetical protein
MAEELSNLGFGRVNTLIQVGVLDVFIGTGLGAIINFFVPGFAKSASFVRNSVEIILTSILTLLVIGEITTFLGEGYRNEPIAAISLVFFSFIVQQELMKKIKAVLDQVVMFIQTEFGVTGNKPGPFVLMDMQDMNKQS